MQNGSKQTQKLDLKHRKHKPTRLKKHKPTYSCNKGMHLSTTLAAVKALAAV
jgi:hypothetical protein